MRTAAYQIASVCHSRPACLYYDPALGHQHHLDATLALLDIFGGTPAAAD